MRRRDFLTLLGTAAYTSPPAMLFATAATVPVHVGFVSGGDKAGAADFVAALRDGLASFGYVEPAGLNSNWPTPIIS